MSGDSVRVRITEPEPATIARTISSHVRGLMPIVVVEPKNRKNML
jgi:hypothetical protein